MRNLILFLIFLILSFSVNIIFYYISEDYRNFLKQLKNQENIEISVDSNDDIIEDNQDEEEDTTNVEDEDTTENNTWNLVNNSEEETENNEDSEWELWDLPTSEISLWKNYTDIIDLFPSYDFSRMELNTNLFDLTNEYPDEYLEFYSRDLTLYFFVWNNYSDLKDIFDVLSQELPFSVNETNNFWDNSFFININEDIDDNVVRTVISNSWVVFWLKINENYYNEVREKLNSLKNN